MGAMGVKSGVRGSQTAAGKTRVHQRNVGLGGRREGGVGVGTKSIRFKEGAEELEGRGSSGCRVAGCKAS